jgi:hypothetical protein
MTCFQRVFLTCFTAKFIIFIVSLFTIFIREFIKIFFLLLAVVDVDVFSCDGGDFFLAFVLLLFLRYNLNVYFCFVALRYELRTNKYTTILLEPTTLMGLFLGLLQLLNKLKRACLRQYLRVGSFNVNGSLISE